MSLSGANCNTNYKPDRVRKIDYISAIGDNVVLITESGWDGRILEYNTTIEINTTGLSVTPAGKLLLVETNATHEYTQNEGFITEFMNTIRMEVSSGNF